MTALTGRPPTDADLRALEARVLAHPLVRDCVVVRRTTTTGETVLVAYAVANGSLSLDSLREHVRSAGTALVPDALVRVMSMPLDEIGAVDEAALVSLPVIEPETVARCDALVRSTGVFADVEVVPEWHLTPGTELRVDELVPDQAMAPDARVVPAEVPSASPRDARPSISIGEPIRFPDGAPRDLPDLLRRAAEQRPTHGVTCVEQDGEHAVTYPELCRRAERVMAALRWTGLHPGDPVVFLLDRNLDFVTAFWGCVLGGFVPVPMPVPTALDPTGPGAAKLKSTWLLLGRPLVITSVLLEPELAHVARALGLADFTCRTIDALVQGPAGETWHHPQPDDLALLLLTSGSTGLAKAVTQTHRALVAACHSMAQRAGLSDRDVPLNWMSLDHGGGIIMCHLVPVALGGRQVHARTEYILQDILRWMDLIDRHRATFTWAPNFAFALVNSRADEIATRRWDLSSMGFVLNGGEAVVPQTARRFLRLLASHGLPLTAMRPAWGMAETSSAATMSSPLLLDTATGPDRVADVGPPDPGFEVRIVDESGSIAPEGLEGRLEVRGVMVTRGYLHNPEANAESFTSDGWFRTGDLGTLRDGRLTITGREKGVIIINGVNYYAHEIEAAVEDVPEVTPSFTAAFAARRPGAETDDLVVAFHTPRAADPNLLKSIRSSVLDRVGVAPTYLLPVDEEDIPKTSIGKIQRAALARRFERGDFSEITSRVQQLTARPKTVPDWFFRPVWRRRPAESHRPVGLGCTVVLIRDTRGLAAALERALQERGARCLGVDSGCSPRLDDAGTDDGRGNDGLERIIEGVPANERLVVVYGDGYGKQPGPAEPDEGAAALATTERIVALARSVTRAARGRALELLVYEDGVQYVRSGDRCACGKAPTPALLKTIHQEHPEIAVRHVDVPPSEPEAVAGALLAELEDRRDEAEVAHRGADRWVRRLEKRPAYPSSRGFRLGRTGGFYLVTGGLGGIGGAVCKHLLRTSDVPLLIVGQQPITGTTDERRALLLSLSALGAVHVETVDVANHEALELAVASAAKRWGRPLAGVLHLAGVFEPRPLAEETPATIAVALDAKVRGGWNIGRLLMDHPAAVLVAFSSVNGYFGGYAAGAYSAASAFLDGLVQHQVTELGRAAYSLAWSLWDGVGMSRKYDLKDAAERVGYCPMRVEQAITSLIAATGSEPGHLLIGLDSRNPHIGRHAADGVVSAGLTAYGVRETAGDLPVLPPLVDRFGASVSCRVRDVAHVAARHRPDNGAPPTADAARHQSAFGSDLERTIALVWQETLPSGGIGRDDNFFDAGASSLMVATVSRKLGQVLRREVPMTEFYRFPTVRLLAAHWAGREDSDAAGLSDSEARGRARRSRQMQRRRRDA